MGLFGIKGWEAKTEQQLIRRIESMMKKFFTEPFRGVKAKVRSIDDNGANILFKKFFFHLEIKSLFCEKTEVFFRDDLNDN